MSRFGPTKYQQYVSDLNKLCSQAPTAAAGRLLLVCGADEYLVNRSATAIRQSWQEKLDCPGESEEAGSLTKEQLHTRAESRGLFDSSTILLIRRLERKNNVEAFLSETISLENSSTIFILTYVGSAAQAKIKKEIQRLNGEILNCYGPSPRELIKFIQSIAKRYDIDLDTSAARTLESHIGSNVAKLTNEIDKLALAYAGRKEALSSTDIAPSLGILREDDVFAIDDALLTNQIPVAMALIHQLLERGESAIAINSILARHARNALLIIGHTHDCVSPRDFAQATGLPPFVAEKYARALKRKSATPYQELLQELRNNDQILKSCKQDKEITLCAPLALLAKSNDHKY